MPRKITGAAFLSLDGVMQAPGGPTEDPTGGFDEGGWVFKLADEGIGEMLGALFTPPYALLLGRRTYDIFAAYWPYTDHEDGGMGEALTQADKFVLTGSDKPLEWENSHRLTSLADVAELKRSDGPDLLIQGSSTLYPALLQAGLLDTLITMTYPVLLGGGKRLFGDMEEAAMLQMRDHRVTDKGTVIATYRPSGPLPDYPAGDAPKPATSQREADRQAAIRDGNW